VRDGLGETLVKETEGKGRTERTDWKEKMEGKLMKHRSN